MDSIYKTEKDRIINTYLNDYCKGIKDTIFSNNIENFMFILYDAMDVLTKNDIRYSASSIKEFDILNPDFTRLNIYMPISESIRIVRGYLQEKAPDYLSVFDKFIIDGTLALLDNEEFPETQSASFYNYQTNHHETDVVITHNYNDPRDIIHEFMHTLNRKIDDNTEVRSMLTELVSIFFETDLYRYMEKVGYDITEINASRRFRLDNCFDICEQTGLDLILIDAFERQGLITEHTYQERKELKIFPNWKNKHIFDKHINFVSKTMKQKKFDPQTSVNYVLGTLISFYCINKNDSKMVEKFIKLNESLKGNISFFKALKIIDIDLNDEETMASIYESFAQEIIKINKTQQDINTL